MSPELAVCGSPLTQRAISSPPTQSACTNVWLSPSAALNRVYPSVMQRSMQASATSRWMVVNSNDSALTGRDSPASASASNPSTSILMKEGLPCLPISASSVVTGTSTDPVQRWLSQPGASRAAPTNATEAVETVGLSALIIMLVEPAERPTAAASIATSALRPYNTLSTRTRGGCGPTATPRAPNRRNEATRSPTWAPISNTRSPRRTKPP